MTALLHFGIKTGTFALALELFQDLVDRSMVILDMYDWHVTDHPLLCVEFGQFPARETDYLTYFPGIWEAFFVNIRLPGKCKLKKEGLQLFSKTGRVPATH